MGRSPIPVLDKKINTAFTLSPKAITKLDEMRGKTSRSAYVEELLQKRGGL